MKINKTKIYNKYGIEFKSGKIFHPFFGYIPEMLVNGNEKIGSGIWHFSTLPGNIEYNFAFDNDGKQIVFNVFGTCPITCKGCYAMTGNYRYDSVKKALAIRTWLARNDIDFVKRAIMAQIEIYKVEFLRIHASGDFFSDEYINMWREIVRECKNTVFWTYTKNMKAESAFDEFQNANIVKSFIPHFGMNFGHCDYIIAVYNELKKQGKSVYICRCGIDKNQHCTNCKGCSKNEFVLFIEHSTEYKAEKDPLYETLKAIIETQEKP